MIMKKIGIFGGLFDPVHLGHLNMAQCALEQAELDNVIFVPNGNPPHKNGDCADFVHRFKMLLAATADNPRFCVSDCERTTGVYHYTVDTMRHFRAESPDDEFFFILGADSLDYVDTWMGADELIRENVFIAVNRNFRSGYSLRQNIAEIEGKGGRVIEVQMPAIDISSTGVRRLAADGCDVRRLTGDTVAEYIKQNKLYMGENR